MLLVLKVYKVAECPSSDTLIDGLVPTDLAKFQMSISCFKLCANQMMALLPGYSQVSLPLTPFCLRRNHLMQLLQFFQMKKVTLRKQKRLLAQGHKYILSAFLLVVVELRVHTCTRPPTLPSLHVLMGSPSSDSLPAF